MAQRNFWLLLMRTISLNSHIHEIILKLFVAAICRVPGLLGWWLLGNLTWFLFSSHLVCNFCVVSLYGVGVSLHAHHTPHGMATCGMNKITQAYIIQITAINHHSYPHACTQSYINNQMENSQPISQYPVGDWLSIHGTFSAIQCNLLFCAIELVSIRQFRSILVGM